jgi:hypothetical protein
LLGVELGGFMEQEKRERIKNACGLLGIGKLCKLAL